MSAARSGQFHRLPTPPRAAVACRVDGEMVEACEGDTVIAAILAHRRALRTFEFAPAERSGFCLMGACQDCWVALEDGTPIRACTTPLVPGMSIVSVRTGADHG